MITRKINWNVNQNYTFKPVDTISILNNQVYETHSAWESDEGLKMPTTALWINYKSMESQRTTGIPFIYFEGILSSSFNKIIFPSIHPTAFLTQSLNSAVYYLDVYNSNVVTIDINSNEHLYKSHSIYADTPNLIFQNSSSTTGYSSFALIPTSKAFGISWCDISGSGAISASYLPFTYYSKPSSAMYGMYMSTLNQTGSLIKVGSGSVERFFAIHLDKNALKNGIIPGTLQIPLMKSASFNSFTSSNIYTHDIISLTDYTESIESGINVGKYSYIVSGTIGDKKNDDIYGTVYYDLGIILLDSDKLNTNLNLNLNFNFYPFYAGSGNLYENNLNTVKLFNSIQACSYKNTNTFNELLITSSNSYTPEYFKCKVSETTVQNPLYIVLKPNEFTYSTNPSWQKNELIGETIIVSSSIPTSCDSFKKISVGCNELQNSQQKYVYWYYPNKELPEKVYAAYFTKNQNGICNCEFLGDLNLYKKSNTLPHINYKSFSVKTEFLNNPITYITTIGLYDDTYQLLAVGKLSKPFKKDQFTTYMFKINLKI